VGIGFFGGGFGAYNMIIELIEDWNLWLVTIISQEAFNANRKPEEVFLLENVEQILTGFDRKMPDSQEKKLVL
jgi:hypothetical protein